MIRALIATCLRARTLVLLLAVGVMVAGVEAARSAPVDAFPEFAPPLVEVQTEAPGMSSLEVEELVTTPLEAALAGTSRSTKVRSKSVLGLSSVVVLFDRDTDPLIARQLVQERVARAVPQLPAGIPAPAILPPVSSTSRILKIGLTSSTRTQTELTELVEWTLRPRLLAIPGVANVAVWGARSRELAVVLDPARLDAAGLGMDQAARALQGALPGTLGGYIDGPLQRMPLRPARPDATAEALAALPVAVAGGAPLHVEDVAQVADSFPPPIGDAVVNDRPGLLLIIGKEPRGNTLEITRRVDEAIAALRPAMREVEIDASIFRPASFIARSIANLRHALIVGCGLVVLILLLFLWNLRTAVISLVAIPLSLGVAVLVLRAFGGTLDTMVLAGLVIALGEVVDDAIIDVENILRRLRENSMLAEPRPAIAVALDASLEVRSAVVHATAIVMLVFLPIWFLGGVAGAFFRPLALAYALGVLASMLVALTVTPAMSLVLLPAGLQHNRPSPLLQWLDGGFRRLLPAVLSRPRALIALGAVMVLVAAAGFATLGSAFLPAFRENDFLMHWVAQPGTSLPALRRTALRVSPELRAIPGVTSFGAHLGRAETADEVVGPNFGELWVHVDADADHARTEHAIAETIGKYTGLRRDVETYLRERIDEVITGTHGALVVRVLGPDLDVLRRSADAIAARVRSLPEVSSAQVAHQQMVPEVRVAVREEAAALGFLPGDVHAAVSLLVAGRPVGSVIRSGRTVPVVVRGPEAMREDLSSLADAPLVSQGGARARLRDVAALTIEPTPGGIPHEDGLRRIDISIAVDGDLGRAAEGVGQALSATRLPAAHRAELLGEWRERQDASRRMGGLGCLSLALILLVLRGDLGNWRRTALVAASLPLALVGGVAGAWMADGVLSLGSLVGFVTVLGIAARNGILLVSHYRYLEQQGTPFGPALVLEGTLERLGPILMTALSTALALVPLVLSGDQPGHEIEHPMAVVILGGLLSSTLLNLLLVPALYLRFGGPDGTQPSQTRLPLAGKTTAEGQADAGAGG